MEGAPHRAVVVAERDIARAPQAGGVEGPLRTIHQPGIAWPGAELARRGVRVVEAAGLEHVLVVLDAGVARGLALREERAAEAALDTGVRLQRLPSSSRTSQLVSLICWLSAESPVVIDSASFAWRVRRLLTGLRSKRLTWRMTSSTVNGPAPPAGARRRRSLCWRCRAPRRAPATPRPRAGSPRAGRSTAASAGGRGGASSAWPGRCVARASSPPGAFRRE